MGAGKCFRAQNNTENRHDSNRDSPRYAPPARYYVVNDGRTTRTVESHQLGHSRRRPVPGLVEHSSTKQEMVLGRPVDTTPVPRVVQELLIVASFGASDGEKMDVLRVTSAQGEDSGEGECALCYEELHKAEVSVLCDGSNRRVCRHFYHTKCCQLMDGSRIRTCPLCRRDFHHTAEVPNPTQDPRGWFQAVDADGSMDLDKTEVVDALGAVFPVDPKALTQNLKALWERWDKTKSGSITLPEFVDPNQGLLQWVVTNQCRLARKRALNAGIPDIRQSRTAWFDYWDADGNQELDKEEVMRALLKTFRHADVGVTRSVVAALWTDFDTDNGGTIDREEFMRPNIGLLDTILANLALPEQH